MRRILIATALGACLAPVAYAQTVAAVLATHYKAMGGLDKMHEAGVILIGGHSIDDPVPKYGLAVTGTIHPTRVILNTDARAGDRLILTKSLGTGIISTALKNGKADDGAVARATRSMKLSSCFSLLTPWNRAWSSLKATPTPVSSG